MAKPRRSGKIRRERLEHQWGKPFHAIYRELRVERGLDPDETARICGVSRTTVWRWLRESEQEPVAVVTANKETAA
jgi:DNA invertase Pin-like site-specific DNA recombinase